jgi:hypothetical protein
VNTKEERLAVVAAALGRTRRASVILACVVLALAGIAAGNVRSNAFVHWVIGGFFAAVAMGLLWLGLVKNSPARSPLMRALRQRPDDLVWVYCKEFSVSVHGAEVPGVVRDVNIVANLVDGSACVLVVHKDRAREVLSAISAVAPRAATGYSDARQEEFRCDPRSLLGAGSVAG